MLAERVTTLAPELLPAGRRDGQEWQCGNLAGERGKSLSVRLTGERAGVWSDFASGERGDALDLVAAVLYRGNRGEAMRWARRWLGLDDAAAPRPSPPPAAPVRQAGSDADTLARRRKALALFLSAPAGLIGTPAADYLAGRGIDLREMGRQPAALRFHPDCWCAEAGRPLPALLAAITEGGGPHVATHRTWIWRDANEGWRKARLKEPKKTLGSYSGGVIPLQRGASGKPLRQAPDGEHVVLAEGIETALSIAVALPALRVLAGVSLGNLARIALPAAVRRVTIAADNDQGNAAAATALDAAVRRFLGEGRDVRIARSPVGSDFNDLLNAGEQAA